MTGLCRVIPCARCPEFAVDTRAVIGSHVELYGAVGPSGGPYMIQLDNDPPLFFNASRDKFCPQTILHQSSGLSPGMHTMRISNTPFSGQTLNINYAVFQGPP